MNKFWRIMVLGLLFPLSVSAMGSQQASDSATRGNYLSGLGYIVQPQEIRIDSYIAQIDYNYPVPDRDAINVITATDFKNDTAFIQIGLKGRKIAFSALPPLNIAFVIDKSGSMTEQDKMDWVKDSFRVFAEQVRPQDFISLVVFDTSASVLIPSTQIRNYQDRQAFIQQVNAIRAGGGTNVYDGMRLGYTQVTNNFSTEYINRVICLTDGEHNSGGRGKKDILDLAESYNRRNINISTIALGASADISLMVDTAVRGGGSSRFISDYETMVKTFGTELDRLLAPAARMLRMNLTLARGVVFKETWGYEHTVSGNTVQYKLDTIHNGDYETMIAAVQVRPLEPVSMTLGTLTVDYLDEYDEPQQKGPYPITLEARAIQNSTEITDLRVKEAEGYIALGKGLIALGQRAQTINGMQREYNALRSQQNSVRQPPAQGRDNGLLSLSDNIPSQSSAAIQRNRIIREVTNAIQDINDLAAYLTSISIALGGDKYGKELEILSNYRVSFSGTLDSYAAIQND